MNPQNQEQNKPTQQEPQLQSPDNGIQKPKLNPDSIYPTVEETQAHENLTPSQTLAIHDLKQRTVEAKKYVSLRVKAVLVIGILLALSAIYEIAAGFMIRNGIIISIIGGIELAMAAGLLFSKDHNTVGLLLKVLIILRLLSLFFSLANPTQFIINGVALLVLGWAYMRVKSLSFY